MWVNIIIIKPLPSVRVCPCGFYQRNNWRKIASMQDFSNLYERMGGARGVRALVDRFYDLMDTAPQAAGIRALHAKSLVQSRQKLFMFLSGWSGGPPLYEERFGHPRLRQRHFPFLIAEKERDEWLWCMNRALDESALPPDVVTYLKSRFAEIADFMRNRPAS